MLHMDLRLVQSDIIGFPIDISHSLPHLEDNSDKHISSLSPHPPIFSTSNPALSVFTKIASVCWHRPRIFYQLFHLLPNNSAIHRKDVKSQGAAHPSPHPLCGWCGGGRGAVVFCTGVAAAFVHNSFLCEHCSVLAFLCCFPPVGPLLHWVILQAAAVRLWSPCAGIPSGPGWIALDLFNLFRSRVRRFEATHFSINHNLSPCSQLLWNATSAFESLALQLVKQHQ